jgi:hypothetical protein
MNNKIPEAKQDIIPNRKKECPRPALLGAMLLLLFLIAVYGVMIITGNQSDQTPAVRAPLSQTPTPSVQKTSITNEEQFVFIQGGKAYLQSANSGEKQQLPINKLIDTFNISPDGKLMLFNSSDDGEDARATLYIYNFDTKTTTQADNFGPNTNAEEFSPDGKYVIIDTGTGTGDRGKFLYEIGSGKTLWQGSANYVIWSSDSSRFAVQKAAFSLESIGSEASTESILLETIAASKLTEKTLFTGDNHTSYENPQWTENGELAYEKNTYSKAFPEADSAEHDQDYYAAWQVVYSSPDVEHLQLDLDTMKSSTYEVEPSEGSNWMEKRSPLGDYTISTVIDESTPKYYLSLTDDSARTEIKSDTQVLWKP